MRVLYSCSCLLLLSRVCRRAHVPRANTLRDMPDRYRGMPRVALPLRLHFVHLLPLLIRDLCCRAHAFMRSLCPSLSRPLSSTLISLTRPASSSPGLPGQTRAYKRQSRSLYPRKRSSSCLTGPAMISASFLPVYATCAATGVCVLARVCIC